MRLRIFSEAETLQVPVFPELNTLSCFLVGGEYLSASLLLLLKIHPFQFFVSRIQENLSI